MRTRTRALALVLALGALAAPARAQMPDVRQMHGIPRPEGKNPPGTVTVRVVRGALGNNVKGSDVVLEGKGGPRTAKTDAEGRARFDELPVGETFQAKTTVDGIALESRSFEILGDVGIALLLTTPPKAGDIPRGPDTPPAMPEGMPEGMPAPTEAHGIAIENQATPIGVLRIILVRDTWQDVIANHPVTLVGLDARGELDVRRAMSDRSGHADFLRLRAGYAYYAIAQVETAQLISQPLVAKPEAGQVVALALGGSENASNDPTAILGSDQIPVGQFFLGVIGPDGELVKSATGRLRKITADGKAIDVASASTRDGRLVFSDFAAQPGDIFLAETERGDITYRTKPFYPYATTGTATTVVVGQPLLVGFHAGAELDDELLRFQAQYMIANVTGAPLEFKGDGLVLPLPKGFLGAQVDPERASQVKIVEGRGIAWKGAVPPGQDAVSVSFALKLDAGQVRMRWEAPFGLAQWLVAVDKVPGMTVEPPGTAKEDVFTGSDGRPFWRWRGGNLAPGGSLRFEFSGLPAPPPTFKRRRELAVAVSAALLLAGIIVAMLANLGLGDKRVRIRAQLERRRETLLGELAALERRYAENRIDERTYTKERGKKLDEVTETMRQIDRLVDEAAA